MSTPTSLYLDTNIFLHYPPVDQIDWLGITGAESVELVVCMPVVHELDEKKNDPLLGERAKRSLQQIAKFLNGARAVREEVTLTADLEEAVPADMTAPLVHAVRDDQILHLVKKAAARGKLVAVATEDTGLTLKCRHHGISLVCPPIDSRLESPGGAQAKLIRELQAELTRWHQRRATLEVTASTGFNGKDASTEPLFARRFFKIVDVEEEALRIRQKHRPIRMGQQAFHPLIVDPNMMSNESVRVYNTRLNDFYEEYEEYCRALNAYRAMQAHVLQFSCWLENRGSLPGEDISVEIVLPIGLFTRLTTAKRARDTWNAPPIAPRPPDPPQTIGQRVRAMHRVPEVPPPPQAKLPLTTAGARQSVSEASVSFGKDVAALRIRVERLRHNDRLQLGRFAALIDQTKPIRPFEARWTIYDSTNPDALSGRILFRIE